MSEYLWMKQDVVAETCDRPEIVKKVLVLYTGGTIGMKWNVENGEFNVVCPFGLLHA